MPTRVPCVGAIVLDERGRLLLIRRGQEPAKGLWSIPGGRLHEGEDPRDGCLRELREEADITGTVVREVGTIEREAPTGDTYVIADFLVVPDPGQEPHAGDDATDACWATRAELLALPCSPGLVQALTDWDVLPR